MSLIVHPMRRPLLNKTEIDAWRSVPSSIISDERNRSGAANASIGALSQGRMVGQAFTVQAIAADNLAIHHAIAKAFPGAVLVIDAGGYRGNAVWGGITQRAAELRGLAGVVIDGCVRDVADIRASLMPCYAAGVVPAGPHKGWGGTINGTVQIGGCPVDPGDLVVGDEDGVAVVPFNQREVLLAGCLKRMRFEDEVMRRLQDGETTLEILNLDG